MSPKASGGDRKITHAKPRESAPPLLSEELIAKLQGAVVAARRQRMQLGYNAETETDATPAQAEAQQELRAAVMAAPGAPAEDHGRTNDESCQPNAHVGARP